MNKHISNDTELKEYFNHCKENGIEIWYTKKFKITKNTLSGGVDQLYDWEGLYEQIGIGLYNDGYRKYADRGHHFWLAKWLINDIMYNGIKIPFQVSMIRVKTWLDRGFSLDQLKSHYTINNRSKYGYKVHPGTGKINYCNFLRMYEVPAMITVLKDDNLRFDGEILDYTGYKRILNGVREYYSDGGVQIFYSNDYLDPLVKIDIGTTHCDYKIESWKWDPPSTYGKIVSNTLPFKVFICAENDENYENCKLRILNHEARNIFFKDKDRNSKLKDAKLNHSQYSEVEIRHSNDSNWGKYSIIGKRNIPFDIEICRINKTDIYKIPKLCNYQGFSVYTNSEVMWKNDIFELLFFGKSDWAMSQTKNKEVILFNCQYSGWKYLKSNQKIASEDVGVIPIHYEGGLE